MIDFARFRPHLIKYEHKNMTQPEQEGNRRQLAAQGYDTVREGTDSVAWRHERRGFFRS